MVLHKQMRPTTFLPPSVKSGLVRGWVRTLGLLVALMGVAVLVAMNGYDPADPSLNRTGDGGPVANTLGHGGAVLADLILQSIGAAGVIPALCLMAWGGRLLSARFVTSPFIRVFTGFWALFFATIVLANFPAPQTWPLNVGLGGVIGQLTLARTVELLSLTGLGLTWGWVVAGIGLALALGMLLIAVDIRWVEWYAAGAWVSWAGQKVVAFVRSAIAKVRGTEDAPPFDLDEDDEDDIDGPVIETDDIVKPKPRIRRKEPKVDKSIVETPKAAKPSKKDMAARQGSLKLGGRKAKDGYQTPPLDILAVPDPDSKRKVNQDALAQNAKLLESVLQDFGVQGEIVKVRPGPVVTLYELDPAPGTKTARVIGLADDIARSMSAVSVRIAVVPGSSVIGIELPNAKRDMVAFRELIAAKDYTGHGGGLALALGKDIGGGPVYVDLARMPHLLIAGTTGSGKSVAVNTMILSLLYRLSPHQCRLIMIDPKMLELSVYDGIPHLLSPVVTDPSKAVVALKWAVREMEDRYRAMSQLGVRNIDGYNQRVTEAAAKGETITRTVQTGFDPETGKPIYENQDLDLHPLPYIVVIVDEMADLMLVAGKDVEAAIQRLAQMARAAGIHLIMATQRPSVDVITGTIKANFPTRISFQVTSKIDSRTILGEQGAEQLLGQGDMLYMAAGGRITRVHGPFVSDGEVEEVVRFLKDQGEPEYVQSVTEEDDDAPPILGMDGGGGAGGNGSSGDDLYDQAVALVLRERKASTSFVQRHLQIGYNRAARLIERMEAEGVISKANHVGKREVLAPNAEDPYQ